MANEVQTYRYDELGRLISVEHSGTVNNNQAHSLCYDPAGNRVHYKSDAAGSLANCASVAPVTAPSVSVGDASATEGGSLVFAVSLSGPHTSNVSASWTTADGTALAGGDYAFASGTVTFSPGQTSRTITVATIDNTQSEPTENMYINLAGASSGSSIADGQGIGSIADNDAVNSPPNVVGESVSTNTCRSTSINVLANDSDPEGNVPLTLVSISYTGGLGSASMSGSFVQFTSFSQSGGDEVRYTVSDSLGATATGTVLITINDNGGCN